MICSDILLDLYQCPAEPERWQRVLDGVCAEIGVISAVVQQLRPAGNLIEQLATVRDTASTRHAELHDRLVNNSANPRFNLQAVSPYPSNAVRRDSDYCPSDTPQWTAFRDRLREAGLGASIGAGVERANGETISVILHRSHGDSRPFTEHHEQFLLALLPHIENAMRLGQRLDDQASRLRQIETMADGLPIGMLTFDHERQITWANDAADEILRRSPHLRAPGGRLCASVRREYDEFESRLIQGTVLPSTGFSKSVVLAADEEEELHIVLVPPASPGGDAALLLSQPRRMPTAPVEDIARLLRVTPAEARVAAALCAGNTLKEYAQDRGITEGSARNQLKQVLAKTGTRRQSELVRHLCNSVIFQAGNRHPTAAI
jgi:DNA-binding CsgD family transcriptional regulator/PAS domain-containing protein